MPFIKRKITPTKIRQHETDVKEIFEEHSDVANNTLVNALKQLSSLTFHAEDIFREIETEAKSVFQRCNHLNKRIKLLFDTTLQLNPKEVQIPYGAKFIKKVIIEDYETGFQIISRSTQAQGQPN